MRDAVAAARDGPWRRDAAALLGVALAQVAVFALPAATKWRLSFAYTEPTVLTAYTSHFVHFRVGHLAPTLGVYLAVAAVAYALSAADDRLNAFYAAAATYLLAFPFALSALNVALARPRVSYGFSGITMAFVGLLTVRAADRVDVPPVSVFAAGAAFVLLYGPPDTDVSLGGSAAALGLSAVSGGSAWHRAVRERGDAAALVAGAALVGALVLAFPRDPTGPGRVVNLYAHALGFSLGALVPRAADVVASE